MTGANFRKALERLGLSQTDFARFLGVTDRTVRHWCKDGIDFESGHASAAAVACLRLLREFDPVNAREIIFRTIEEEEKRRGAEV